MSYASLEYEKALALGQKEYKACQAKGLPLYPPVLDEVLTGVDTRGEVELGLVDVPIHLITGTRSAGRQRAFSPSFYPLLGADTELAAKWTALCSAHLSEGINEPIKVYEYLHDFYVQEGHKRVSVLRYFEAVTIPAGQRRTIPTGIAIALPSADYVALVYARSGLGIKHGIAPANCVGVIDSDYRGEILVGLQNSGESDFAVQPGDRIAQLMIAPVVQASIQMVDELDGTARGAGGFGSTGK